MRIALRVLAGFVVLLLLAATAAWLYLHESLPRLEGEVSAKGAAAEIEILRDAEGIPHIFAKSEADAWFALGYAHAQDRLWQMEFQRRVGQGRLSEFLG